MTSPAKGPAPAMTPDPELDALVARLRSAHARTTKGPWTVSGRNLHYARKPRVYGGDHLVAEVGNSQAERQDAWEDDAAFIVAAHEDLPRLLTALASLREQVRGRDWQDIATAPKERERVLLAWADCPSLPTHVELGWRLSDGWANTYGKRFSSAPTHYMLLPRPPALAAAPPVAGEGAP
jgi:hypothetical protein